ncbi:MAG: DUF4123 domain-containing protein [Thermomonas sp.]|uniref:DUF4123 domain-containing protein n=1 Tax=Thermomonas sp. TaxID=1971895 RepID=UPI0039E4B7A9
MSPGVIAGSTGQQGTIRVIGQAHYEQLRRTVFGNGASPVFAVLDGAIIDDLPSLLQRNAPEALCLFSGSLDPMLAAAAPYVMQLDPDATATQMALRDGWNDHWGIVLVADPGVDLHAVRSHLRRVLRVRTPDGNSMLFRFYDPRAFRTVIPSLDAPARREFFGPIRGIYVEGRSQDSALYFARDGGPGAQPLALSSAA